MSITCRIFRGFFFSLALRRTNDIGASPSLSVSLSLSWNGLVDTDSESTIFSSGLLALFYLCFCDACTPFSSTARPPLSADSARSFALFTSFSACVQLFLFFASPPLPRIASQILTYDYGQANVWISACSSEWRSGPLKMSDNNTLSYFNIRLTLAKVVR